MVMLEFKNYLIQKSYQTLTCQFINHIIDLRQLIIKFKSDHLQIDHKKIDFDEECNSFLNKYVVADRNEDVN